MFRKVLSLVLLGAALALAGCSSSKPSKVSSSKNRFGESLAGFEGKGSPHYKGKGKIPRGGGRYHVGKPYQVAGRWFQPKEQPGYNKTGAASWYGEAFHGRKTSNGEFFDMNMLTAAHPTLPLPSYARVSNLANNRTIIVRINDRGPFVGTRIIDLSKASAVALDFKNKGKANVKVEWIGKAPLNDQGSHLAMMNRTASTGASMRTLIAAAGGPARGGNGDVQVAVAKQKPAPMLQQAAYEPEKKARNDQAHIIQIGAFRSLDGAENARRALSAIGPVQVYEWQTAEGPLYKVQMGPFMSAVGARNALTAVQEQGFAQAVLEAARIEQVAYKH